MLRILAMCVLLGLPALALAQTPAGAPPAQVEPPAEPPADARPAPADPPLETIDADALLAEFATLIAAKRLDDLFVVLVRAANLTHPAKNIDPEALRRIGHNLLGLFLDNEQVHYVDRVADETHGKSLRRVVLLAYTSRDRWIYFTVILKRGAVGWQVTKFDYAVDRFDLFPSVAGD